MIKHTRNKFFIAICAVIAPVICYALTPSTSVLLKTAELTGADSSQKVTAAAIPSGGHLTGKFVNKTGRVMTDVTVTVTGDKNVPAGTGGTPPAKTSPEAGSGGTVVTRPGTTNDSTAASSTTSNGFSSTIHFGTAPGGAGPLKHDDSLNVDIHVNKTGTAGKLEITFTPSDDNKPKDSNMEADILQSLQLDEAVTGGVLSIAHGGHDRASTYISNGAKSSITEFSGTCYLPDGETLNAVYLQDPSSKFDSPLGTTIQLDGDHYQVTGFTPLGPLETYELIFVFSSSMMEGSYKVLVDAGF